MAIAQGIHRLPEAAVVVGVELALCGDPGQTILFPYRVITTNGFDYGGLKHKEATVDPGAIALRFLLESQNPAPLKGNRTKTAWRLHGGEGG